MRVVVIGCGLIAQEHLRSIRRCPEVEIVGIADPNPVVLQATAAAFAVENTYEDARTMIVQQKPDVVHVATPPGNHEEMVRFALESGCHVYVEKPITLRAPEAEALVALAESKGLLSRLLPAASLGATLGLLGGGGIAAARNPAWRKQFMNIVNRKKDGGVIRAVKEMVGDAGVIPQYTIPGAIGGGAVGMMGGD